ncbi:hypothetical protein E2562_036230 [Oryza meyeriana var. granulata]|uniref:Uncharacterized protein n=1 Tax=Oryza meyeriana var. granulata TaxID=110450 RepID=A0A6G1ET52_9ORYZ|nr:hypothetical protein E2562_036230 [Oryza meyeriana var. granulata]
MHGQGAPKTTAGARRASTIPDYRGELETVSLSPTCSWNPHHDGVLMLSLQRAQNREASEAAVDERRRC